MGQYQITLDEKLLQRLFQNDGLRPLLEQIRNQAVTAQVTAQIGVAPHERSEEPTYRNGCLTLRGPKLRQNTFTPDLFERYQCSEMALLACMVEMVVQNARVHCTRAETAWP